MRLQWMMGLVVPGAIALVSPQVLAHGTRIQSRLTQAVEVQAEYDSGEPMKNAQVQVFSPANPQSPTLKGSTDAAGRFTFTPTEPGNWEVSVRQAGHGAVAVIPVQTAAVVPAAVSSNNLTPVQHGLMLGAVTWGCVGTALYFRRGKQ